MAGGHKHTALIFRVQDFHLDEESVFLSETSVCNTLSTQSIYITTGWHKKREILKNPTKIEEIQEKNLLTEIEPLQLAF